jgi:hypothetical protein
MQSAFFQTPLEILLQYLGATSLILTGLRDEQLHRLHGARRKNAEFQFVCPIRLFGGADAPGA